jgi:hypothetical protein
MVTKKKEEPKKEYKPVMIGKKTYGQAYFDILESGNYKQLMEDWTEEEINILKENFPLNGHWPEMLDIKTVRLGIKLHRLPSYIQEQWFELAGGEEKVRKQQETKRKDKESNIEEAKKKISDSTPSTVGVPFP